MSIFPLGAQFGLYPGKLVRGLAALPAYFSDLGRFRRDYRGELRLAPALHDRNQTAGSFGEYFWQDLAVARMIFDAAPDRHIDVGSRIDGFIAHLASFREVEVLDIRPLHASIPGVRFRQADLMRPADSRVEPSKSVSCLHTIEHFGLGRYGDTVDVSGMATGLRTLASYVAPGGVLYLSTPIGRERVLFNSHRISAPASVAAAMVAEGLELSRLLWCNGKQIFESTDFSTDFSRLATERYNLGIFVFKRAESAN